MVGTRGSCGITGGSGKGYIVIALRDMTGAGARATFDIGPVTEHLANQARARRRAFWQQPLLRLCLCEYGRALGIGIQV